MKDITYCSGSCCPFTDCEKHLEHIKDRPLGETISIADCYRICRRYIGMVVDEIEKENMK
jgi:hypothetical protein